MRALGPLLERCYSGIAGVLGGAILERLILDSGLGVTFGGLVFGQTVRGK